MARLLAEQGHEVVVDNAENGRRTWWIDAENKETRLYKISDLFLIGAEVRGIALDDPLSRLGVPAPCSAMPRWCAQSLNFHKREAASPRRTSIRLYMTPPRTPHALLATWTALE